MNGKRRFTQLGYIAPGDTYHLHRLLYVSWKWNRYSRRRVYVTRLRWEFEIDMQYAV